MLGFIRIDLGLAQKSVLILKIGIRVSLPMFFKKSYFSGFAGKGFYDL
jgi:hypothetical protein